MAKKKKRINIIILISSLCSIVVISVAAFFIYFSINYKPNEYAKSCMVSDSYVTYKEENDKLYYAPKIESVKVLSFMVVQKFNIKLMLH